jgi:hypothetical protein
MFAADHPLFNGPTTIFDYDPTTNSLSQVDTTGVGGLASFAYGDRMLVLPTGEILLTTGSSQLYVFTPDEGPDPSLNPVIAGIQDNGDGTFTLTGAQLNGFSGGASYGDDAEMDSNYPIVFLTDGNGQVFFARTFNWSPGLVQSGDLTTTDFTLPDGIAPGDYSLQVSGTGLISDPVDFQIGGPSANPGKPHPGHATAGNTSGGQAATVTLKPAAVSSGTVATGVVAAFQSNPVPVTLMTGISSSQTPTVVASNDAVAQNSAATANLYAASPVVIASDVQKAILDSTFATDPLAFPL